MNLTLSIDEQLLKAARKVAIDRNTSVNAMIRDYLSEVTSAGDRHSASLAELDRLLNLKPLKLGNARWTRDELHER